MNSQTKTALIFPGQGSQQIGMGQYLVSNFEIAKKTFAEASEAISMDMAKLCLDSDEQTLALTENTQPALLCVSTATQRVLRSEFNLSISGTAGHSIGEYASLVSAGVLSFSDAMKAVRKRGQAMQAAVPVGRGAMLAILGLENDQVEWLCRHVKESSGLSPISPANFNSPGQVVIAGSVDAIDWLRNNFKPEEIPGSPKRAKLIPLNVSAPFHCEMMKPAEKEMENFLGKLNFSKANFPVYQNHHASPEIEGGSIRQHLIFQVSAPVLWAQTIERMKADGFNQFIECGFGSILKGLLKKIDAELKVLSTNSGEDFEILRQTFGKLSQ